MPGEDSEAIGSKPEPLADQSGTVEAMGELGGRNPATILQAGWAIKKAALDQQASDAARRLFPSEGLDLGDVRTKPISIVGTERQQTVHSRVSGVLAS